MSDLECSAPVKRHDANAAPQYFVVDSERVGLQLSAVMIRSEVTIAVSQLDRLMTCMKLRQLWRLQHYVARLYSRRDYPGNR